MNYALITQSTLKGGKFLTPRSATSSSSRGVYTSSPSDFLQSFYAVLRRWRSETAFASDPDKITSNPSYRALVHNARNTTDLIIDQLRVEPSFLVWVLDDAYGERPYADDDIGDITKMTDAWISWADRNGQRP